MKHKILIITFSNDNDCVKNTTKVLEEHGAKVYRFNSDTFPAEAKISGRFDGKNYRQIITTQDYELDLAEISAIWYRRLKLGSGLGQRIEKKYYKPTIDESNVSFWGVINGSTAFQLDTYMKHRIAANKFKQLELAEKLGMNIPPTLVTNNMSELKKFHKEQEGDVIMKMHHSFAIYDQQGSESVVFTNEFTEEFLEDEAGLHLCPLTFQKNIRKLRELRVTVVGNQIFSAAVDSQKVETAQTDWRVEGELLLDDWYEYDIPDTLQEQILKLMDLYQLNYGAFDFIETHSGDFYFLEVNSGGEFMWLDTLFKGEISKSIALVLLNKEERRIKQFPIF